MVLGLSEAATVAIAVAVISSVVGPTILAIVTRREIKSRVGRPNGKGNVVQMQERTLEVLDRLDERLGSFEHRVTEVDERTAQMVDSQAAMVASQASQAGQDRRLAVLERDQPPWWLSWAPVAAGAALAAALRRRT